MRPEPGLSLRASLERLKAAGLEPRTVFDVGVATGTPELYGVFDDVAYVLVEPLEELAPFMTAFVAAHPGSVAIHAAVGRAIGEAVFRVTRNVSGSSFVVKANNTEPRTVPVVTLDDVVATHAPPAPYLLKLDVQGYELEALAGAEACLEQMCAVIAEVSLWSDRKGRGARFADLVAWMSERDFVLFDVAQIVRRTFDQAIVEMDLVFLPSRSRLREISTYKLADTAVAAIKARRKDFGLE